MGFVVGVPLKAILPYWADSQNEAALVATLTNQGYAICDGSTLDASHQDINGGGTYTLPDLRNRFLIGGDITKTAGTAGTAVGSGTENSSAGAPGPKGTGGNNSNTLATNQIPAHKHGLVVFTQGLNSSGGQDGLKTSTEIDGSNSANPPIYNTTDDGGTRMQNTGGGAAHESRPLYTGIIWIMKVKN